MPSGRLRTCLLHQFALLLLLSLAATAPTSARPLAGEPSDPSVDETSGGAAGQGAPQLPVTELRLENGLTFLLVPRPQTTTVAAGWVARVGSADETLGRTGLSHLIEHMLFKGTRTIGTRDPTMESTLLAEQDDVWEEIRELESKPGGRAQRRLEALRRRFSDLVTRTRALAFLGEFSFLYSEAGGVGLNASTLPDLTFYWVTLPAEKLELWFWLESDRLLHPVFREFYKEKTVIAEERRQRVESRPEGEVDAAIRADFWAGTPYAWPPIGRPGELDGIARSDLEAFYRRRYTPDGLTAVLVGDFDPAAAAELARRYFGRWNPTAEPPPVLPRWSPASPEGTVASYACECPAQARAQYLTVPFGHPDSYALQLLAGVLNGRSGRLYRSLVLEREIAFAAGAGQYSSRRAGYFGFEAETRGEATPGELVAAWDEELARLLGEPIPEHEVQRVKNQVTADAFRRLKEPEDLMKRLLVYSGMGSWREVEEWPRRILELTPEEVRESAVRYLRPERRRISLIYRGAIPEGQ